MKKILTVLSLAIIFSSCSDEEFNDYSTDAATIFEDMIEDKSEFLVNVIDQNIENIVNQEDSIDLKAQFEEFYLLQSNYEDELTDLNNYFSKKHAVNLNEFDFSAIKESDIQEISASIVDRLNQSWIEVFGWEMFFDIIIAFIIEMLILVVLCFLLIMILLNGSLEEHGFLIPETDDGCFSIPSMIFVGTLLVAIFVRPAERIGLVSSTREKEIEKKVEIFIEKDVSNFETVTEYNLKVIR